MEPKTQYWLSEAGTPPGLEVLIGQTITEAWASPGRTLLLLIFATGDPRQIVMAEMIENPNLPDHAMLKLDVGDWTPTGPSFAEMGMIQIEVLAGRTFTELDNALLVFGDVAILFCRNEGPFQFMKRRGTTP